MTSYPILTFYFRLIGEVARFHIEDTGPRLSPAFNRINEAVRFVIP